MLIKNGLLIDPASNKEGEFDVLIEDGKISDVVKKGQAGDLKDTCVIDASNKWVVPGLIDIHVHLREPGYEWKETIESGSRAAVLGGFTSVACMANTKPVNDCAEVTRFIIEKAEEIGLCRVFPIGAVSKSLSGKELASLSELYAAGCVAFSDDGEPVYDSLLMRRALEWSSMLNAPICCHEEDMCLSADGCMNESELSLKLGLRGIPTVSEDVMVSRDIELARITKAHVHFCHISSARSVELIRRAKNDGINVSAEVTPHHLSFLQEEVLGYETNAKMNPPLRKDVDKEALLDGLKDGTLDAIASDHAPHELDRKRVEFSKAAFGIIGLQTTLPLILSFVEKGLLSRRKAIELMTVSPAKIMRLSLGLIKKGTSADLTIIDPEFLWCANSESLVSLSKNTLLYGRTLKGRADTVIREGRVLVSEGLVK